MKGKDDDKAFIFTLKNPHGVKPTRYMKRKGGEPALFCHPALGPAFGYDICIFDSCNDIVSVIRNDGTQGYECHPKYKCSLFVNTNEPNDLNHFRVSDYEVFTYE